MSSSAVAGAFRPPARGEGKSPRSARFLRTRLDKEYTLKYHTLEYNMFVGREKELEFLNLAYADKKTQLIIIYGRRRVGKTELVKQFFKDKDHIYFLADKSSEGDQLKQLSEKIGTYFGDQFLLSRGFGAWREMFRYLEDRLKTRKGRLIFVVDEFPHLAEANRAISSIFQKGFDENLKDSGIFLILMGSSIAMIESEVLAYKAPLYGRRTGQILLDPLDFEASCKFFPRLGFTERVYIYATLGGVPAYLLEFDPQMDFWSNVKLKILTPRQFLYEEPAWLLRQELREPRNYFSILRAIAQGSTKFGQIVNETGIEKNILSKYLGVLSDLKIVEREVPVTERFPNKSKQGSYRLEDNFFRFWFRFVFPNRSSLEEGRLDYVLEKKIKPHFDEFVSFAYEKICLELVEKLAGRLFESFGRWWNRSEEIDIVALNESDKIILLGEVKWSRNKVGTNVLDHLKRKAELVNWHNQRRKLKFALFSRSGFTEALLEQAKKEDILLVEGTQVISN